MNKKAVLGIKTFALAGIVFIVGIWLGLDLITGFNEIYSGNISEGWSDNFTAKYSTFNKSAEVMREKIIGTSEEGGVTTYGVAGIMWKGTTESIRSVGSTIEIIPDIFKETQEQTGLAIDNKYGSAVMIIIIIIIVLAIIGLLLKKSP